MKSLLPSKIPTAKPEDGREEGEIVSDDLEDISDDSIIFTPCNGKSLSHSDHLRALSLSSITDLEDFPTERRRKRKKSFSRRHTRHRKRSRRKLMDADSSEDENDSVDRRLRLQLKAAVRVDPEEVHKNSLRTRLRAMVQSASGPESDNGTTERKLDENNPINKIGSSEGVLRLPEKDITVIEIDSGTDSIVSVPEVIPVTLDIANATEAVLSAPNSTPENLESGSEQPKDDIDSELMQLRIEALKTAINNKFANRKRRKKDIISSTTSDDTNKENTNNNSGKIQEKKTETKVEIPQISPQTSNEPENDAPPSPEEDEDVLRALLLASMSKKITNIEPEPVKIISKTTVSTVQSKSVVAGYNKVVMMKKVNNFKVNNVKKIGNNGKNIGHRILGNTKLVKMPQVKPLIIRVNSDSDSDTDFNSSPEKSSEKVEKTVENDVCKNLEAAIESSVDKFLKEQRAKVESGIGKVIKTNNSEINKTNKINAIETKKEFTIVKDKVNNAITTLGQKAVVKNVSQIQKIASDAIQTTPRTNKANIIINKSTQKQNSTPESSKNLKLAELEKSALKFLPESKREEYRNLQNLLKLKNAQRKKPKIRRTSQKSNDINYQKKLVSENELASNKNCLVVQTVNTVTSSKINNEQKKNLLKQTTVIVPVVSKIDQSQTKHVKKTSNNETMQKIEHASQSSKVMERNQEKTNQELYEERCDEEKTSNAWLLHATLKQMQIRKDGRLQIRERYQSLRPLMIKINSVSKEQKRWDQEVKKLLDQLEKARKKQQEAHESMSSCIQELAEKKQKIDQSLAKTINKPKITNPVTSTPLKPDTSETSLDISAVDGLGPSVSSKSTSANQISTENTLKIDQTKDSSKPTSQASKNNEISKNNTWEESTKINNDLEAKVDAKNGLGGYEVELNVVDPNDIDNIIRTVEEKVAVLEKKGSFECRRSEKVRYVSPLDSVKRREEFDPFAILCPFEVNGTCKDSECTFKHLPK